MSDEDDRKRMERVNREMERFRGPSYNSAMYQPVVRNTEEIQARYNANEMRNLHRQQGENLVKVITERVKMLEAALQADEELAVYCDAGHEQLRVQSFEFPTWNLAVMVGLDANGNQAHRIENVEDVKLTCKVLKSVTADRRPIGFAVPPED